MANSININIFIAVSVYLLCSIPAEYPEILPVIDIEIEKGLGKKHKDELLELALTKVIVIVFLHSLKFFPRHKKILECRPSLQLLKQSENGWWTIMLLAKYVIVASIIIDNIYIVLHISFFPGWIYVCGNDS